MPDREKYIDIFKQVVKAKEKYYKNDKFPIRISYQCVVDILALLKEQPDVVRCKDCKWRGTKACFCKAPNDVKDDWFCSEGERKET